MLLVYSCTGGPTVERGLQITEKASALKPEDV